MKRLSGLGARRKNLNIRGILYTPVIVLAIVELLRKEVVYPVDPKFMWSMFGYVVALTLPITTLIEMPKVISRIRGSRLVANRVIALVSNAVYLIYGAACLWFVVREVLTKYAIL